MERVTQVVGCRRRCHCHGESILLSRENGDVYVHIDIHSTGYIGEMSRLSCWKIVVDTGRNKKVRRVKEQQVLTRRKEKNYSPSAFACRRVWSRGGLQSDRYDDPQPSNLSTQRKNPSLLVEATERIGEYKVSSYQSDRGINHQPKGKVMATRQREESLTIDMVVVVIIAVAVQVEQSIDKQLAEVGKKDFLSLMLTVNITSLLDVDQPKTDNKDSRYDQKEPHH